MTPRWTTKKLGDVIELKRGYDLPQQARVPGAIPVISSAGPTGFHNEAMVRAPGVVTGRYGTIGQVFLISEDFWPLNTTLYVRDFKGNDPRFVSYLLRTVDFYSCSDKAAVPGVNRNHLHELKVLVPHVDAQRAIARVLGVLDDKIDLNRRTSETLEAMARALFKSWFVDFDPVRAKKEGRKPEGMDAATAALFPEDFEESELGIVPRGWSVGDVYALAEVDYGAPYASARFNATRLGRPVIRIRDLRTQEPSVWTTELHPRDVLVHPGDILVGMDGVFRAHIWAGRDAVLNQRVCRFRPIAPTNAAYVRYVIERPLGFVEQTEIATTVIHLGKNDIDRFRIVRPTDGPLQALNAATRPLLSAQVASARESRTLSELRDALLPKLLSGELRVPEAERIVKEAV